MSVSADRCIDKMEERIKSATAGAAFIASDFTDLMAYETAKKAIVKLEKDGKIRRVMRGVYDSPRYSTLLKEYAAPDPDAVAHALARNYNWTIALSGEAALNLLGLSTQVPANWCYISSGPYKKYSLGKIKLEFMHRADREISGMSEKTAVVIQALKTIGKDDVTVQMILALRNRLSTEDKKLILEEGRQTTAWVYSILKKICMD